MMSLKYKQAFVRYAVCCAAMGLAGVAQARAGDKDKNRDKQPVGLQTVVVTGTKICWHNVMKYTPGTRCRAPRCLPD